MKKKVDRFSMSVLSSFGSHLLRTLSSEPITILVASYIDLTRVVSCWEPTDLVLSPLRRGETMEHKYETPYYYFTFERETLRF